MMMTMMTKLSDDDDDKDEDDDDDDKEDDDNDVDDDNDDIDDDDGDDTVWQRRGASKSCNPICSRTVGGQHISFFLSSAYLLGKQCSILRGMGV